MHIHTLLLLKGSVDLIQTAYKGYTSYVDMHEGRFFSSENLFFHSIYPVDMEGNTCFLYPCGWLVCWSVAIFLVRSITLKMQDGI